MIAISIIKVRIQKISRPIGNILKDQEIRYIIITNIVREPKIIKKINENNKLLLISDLVPLSIERCFFKDNTAKINRAIITGISAVVQKGYQLGVLTSVVVKNTISQRIRKNASKIKITPKSNHNLANIVSIFSFLSILYFNLSQEINKFCDINIFGDLYSSG